MDLTRVLQRVINEDSSFFGADQPAEIYGATPAPEGLLHDPQATSWPDSRTKPGLMLQSIMLEVNILKLLEPFIGSDLLRHKIYLYFTQYAKKENLEELGSRIRDNLKAGVNIYPVEKEEFDAKWVIEVELEKTDDDEDGFGELDARMKGQSKELGTSLEISGDVDFE